MRRVSGQIFPSYPTRDLRDVHRRVDGGAPLRLAGLFRSRVDSRQDRRGLVLLTDVREALFLGLTHAGGFGRRGGVGTGLIDLQELEGIVCEARQQILRRGSEPLEDEGAEGVP